MVENKSTFFRLKIQLTKDYNNLDIREQEHLQESIDVFYSKIKEETEYTFQHLNKLEYLFKVNDRKRTGHLIKLLKSTELSINQLISECHIHALKNTEFKEMLTNYFRDDDWTVLSKPLKYELYDESDIKFLDNPKNYHDWQRQLFNFLFESGDPIHGKPKKMNSREVLVVIDSIGGAGKTVLIKYLQMRRPDEFTSITYGTPAQCKSIVAKQPNRSVYAIDLPRSIQKSSNFNSANVLTFVEELVSGLVQTNLYGSGTYKMMNPAAVIIFCNFHLPYEGLSSDRWVGLKIKRDSLVNPKRIYLEHFDALNIDVEKENKKLELESKMARKLITKTNSRRLESIKKQLNLKGITK